MIDLSKLAEPGSIEETLVEKIDFTRLPRHVAVIMDGNGRWARARNLPRVEGHRAGIDDQFFGDHLYTANIDDPDLLIRTSGELRVSNFLLWQIAYAEIHVNKVLWPDFRRRHLFEAIIDFQSRERRYGGVDESDAEMFIEAERES